MSETFSFFVCTNPSIAECRDREKADIRKGRARNKANKDLKAVVRGAHKHTHTLDRGVERGGSKEASAF